MNARRYKTNAQAGFTLVEIAIVLVIIGLLLGGILKGQEMITQAKIKNVINDFNGLSAAVNSYRDRYRMLPGDDNGADTRWGLASTQKGDGDGVIEGKYNDTAGAESQKFWLHLRQAGFVPGSGLDQPRNATAGLIGVQTGNAANGVVLANAATPPTGFTALIMCSTSIPDKVAGAVDAQMDDGLPNTGQLRAFTGAANADVPPSASTAAAYGEAGTTYNFCQPL